MNIRKLHIGGFGALRDAEHELSTPVTLFYGRNEAGKSTTMAFIRTMLFGFPTRANVTERYEPVRGGVHGGYMHIEDRDGALYRVERYDRNDGAAGRKTGGDVRVIRLGDEPAMVQGGGEGSHSLAASGGRELLDRLLGGASPELYRHLFAIGLSELQEISTLQTEQISGYLYSAGIGGGAPIADAEKKLAAELEQLFKPRGKNQEINQTLRRIEEVEADIRRSKEKLGRYNEQSGALAAAEKSIAEARDRLEAVRTDALLFGKALAVREHWVRRLELRSELDELPVFASFPENGAARQDAILQEEELANLQLQRLEDALRKAEAELDAIVVDEALLAAEPAVAALIERLELYQAGQSACRDLLHEQDTLGNRLAHLLRQISQDWDDTALRRFSATVADRELTRGFRDRLAAAERKVELLLGECDRLSKQAAAAEHLYSEAAGALQDQEASKRAQFAELIPETKAQLEALWSALRSEVEAWRRERDAAVFERQRRADVRQAEDAGRQQADGVLRKVVWLSGAAAVAVPLALAATGQAVPAAVSFALLLGATGAALWLRRTAAPAPQRRGRAAAPEAEGARLAEREARVAAGFAALLRPPAAAAAIAAGRGEAGAWPDPAELDRAMQELERAVAGWLAHEAQGERLRDRLAELARARDAARGEHAEQAALLREAAAARDAVRADWAARLAEQGLPAALTPEAVLEIYQYAEQGMALLQQRDKSAAKLDALEAEQRAFEDAAAELLGTRESRDLVFALRQRKAEIARHSALRTERDRLSAGIAAQREEHAAAIRRVHHAKRKLQALYAEAGVGTHEEELFRLRAGQFERRREAEAEMRRLDVLIGTWSEAGQREGLLGMLERYDALQLEAEHDRAKREAVEAEERLAELLDRRGRLRQELDKLQADTEHADKLQLLEEHAATLRQQAARYGKLAICAELFRRTRLVYEQEKQPRVLKRASQYFSCITAGKYKRIIAPIGSRTIEAELADGERIDSARLSRGTAEQLYLAMRFALASEHGTVLPLLLDDIFVNFDGERLRNTLLALNDVAKTHQVVLFTCHEHIRQAVMTTVDGCGLIEL